MPEILTIRRKTLFNQSIISYNREITIGLSFQMFEVHTPLIDPAMDQYVIFKNVNSYPSTESFTIQEVLVVIDM